MANKLNLNRRNHALIPPKVPSVIDRHFLVFYDVESYTGGGGQDPYLLCYKLVEVDLEFNHIMYETTGHFNWDEVGGFIDLLEQLANIPRGDVYAFAHNHHYDLIVTPSGEEFKNVTSLDMHLKGQEIMAVKSPPKESLFELLSERDYRTEIINFTSPKFYQYYKLRKDNTKPQKNYMINVIDSMNYFPMGVAELAKHLGFKHHSEDKDKFKHDVYRVGNDELMKEAIDYCLLDIEVIFLSVLNLFKLTSSNCIVPVSISQASFNHYLVKYAPSVPTIYCHSDTHALNLEYKAYKGARTEVYYQGLFPENITSVDINNLYGYVMANNKFPVNLIKGESPYFKGLPRTGSLTPSQSYNKYRWLEIIKKDIDVLRRQEEGMIIKCYVKVPTNLRICPFALTTEGSTSKDNRLSFPAGIFETYLTTEDIVYAVDNDMLISVSEVSRYEMADLFSKYMKDMSDQRKKAQETGNSVLAFLFKMLPNSLSGKFGQRDRKYKPVGKSDLKLGMIDKGDNKHRFSWYYTEYEKEEESVSQRAVPAISAHITAYARRYMYSFMGLVGFETVVYVDNDGLKLTQEGFNRLEEAKAIRPFDIGFFKKEYVGRIEIDSSKSYVVDILDENSEKVVSTIKKEKLIKSNAELVGHKIYKQHRFTTAHDQIVAGESTGVHSHLEVIPVSLQLHGRYKVDLSDGWTYPVVLYPEEFDRMPLLEIAYMMTKGKIEGSKELEKQLIKRLFKEDLNSTDLILEILGDNVRDIAKESLEKYNRHQMEIREVMNKRKEEAKIIKSKELSIGNQTNDEPKSIISSDINIIDTI